MGYYLFQLGDAGTLQVQILPFDKTYQNIYTCIKTNK
jgi:hypothetical protein